MWWQGNIGTSQGLEEGLGGRPSEYGRALGTSARALGKQGLAGAGEDAGCTLATLPSASRNT